MVQQGSGAVGPLPEGCSGGGRDPIKSFANAPKPMLKWVIAPVVIYGGVVAVAYMAQRLLQYFPERLRTAPAAIGLADAEEVVLDTADGERVIVWHVRALLTH